MNRTSRSVLAIVVGFVGATAVFRAANVEPNTTDEPVVVGEVDTAAHCRVRFGDGSNAMLVGRNAYSWRCSDRSSGLFRLVELNFDDACQERFGEGVSANNWDGSNPYAWECVED